MNELWDKYSEYYYGLELWTIDKNLIKNEEYILNKPTDIVSDDQIKIYLKKLNNFNQLFIINEYYLISRKALYLSAQYAPYFIEELLNLDKTVINILSDIVFLLLGDEDEGNNIKLKLKEYIKTNQFEKQKRINQRITSIVQINAILSKVILQLFSGRIPIDNNECFLASYSLLGIGSAYMALYSFSKYMSNVFKQNPVCTVVEEHFSKFDGIPIYPKIYDYDNDNKWLKVKPDYKHWFKFVSIKESAPKLAYYSGRQGFRESMLYISAPLQVLPYCFSSQWSLLTLSHEFLHAHVDGIIAALFSMNDEITPKDAFLREFKDYLDNIESYCKTNNYNGAKLDKCCRAIIYNYLNFMVCNSKQISTVLTDHTSEKERKKIIIHLESDSPENTWTFFNNYYKDIAEYCVHSLDYKYFYHNKPDIFLFSLWESWSKVPIVSERLSEYIFRCIIALASDLKGLSFERIEQSLKIFSDQISEIKKVSSQNSIYEEIIHKIKNKDYLDRIRQKAKPTLYLIDFFLTFFSHDGFIDIIFNDENVAKTSDGHLEYTISLGEFSDVKVKSPIALTMSLFRKYYYRYNNYNSSDIERLSLWTLLTCSLSLVEEKK